MRIAILGYGKMGRIIEQFATERGHDIVLKVNVDNTEDLTLANLKKADVAIDFSTPDSALSNIELCFDAGVPVVVGTTGWYGHLQTVKNKCEEGNNTLLYASNFSIGVNVFFFVNKVLAICSGEEFIVKPDQLLIESHRIEDVPGTHTVIYSSEVDDIEFKHKAHSRAGFALGAVLAAEWLEDKTGFYNITDMFDFSV
jgi:4-hydroxy-tetrahydrodipicolinate reductase